jgi:hypothetical protein
MQAGARSLCYRGCLAQTVKPMPQHALTLTLLHPPLAVCRLPPDAPLPVWASLGEFVSVTRTADELSIICPQASVPADVPYRGGWRALKVAGPLDFALTSVLTSLAVPLTAAGISALTIATYDTDYVLVQDDRLTDAIDALTRAGHQVAG